MWTTPLLPNNWLTTLAGTTSSFGLQIMPIVLILCGIFLAFIIIRFIISLARGNDSDDWVNPYANSQEDRAEKRAGELRWLRRYYHEMEEKEPTWLTEEIEETFDEDE